MNLKAIVCASKSDIRVGDWKTGKIPKAEFPLSRARDRDYKFGPAYDWCIIKFDALGFDCRVRLLLREGREIFYATLGIVEGGDTRIICSYEFHGTEPGWHCHSKCGRIADIEPGQNRFSSKRLPQGGRFHRDKTFGVTKNTAKHVAFDFYRIYAAGTLV